MRAYLHAVLVILASGVVLFNTSYAIGQHVLGHRLDVRNYPANIPVIHQIGAVHTYPEAFDNSNHRHPWGALGGSEGGNVLDDTSTECANGNCIDISTINYIMSEAPCIWPAKPYYAVVGICWNAANRALFFTQKTVHNVKFYNIAEWWFGTYGLDDTSACLDNTCRQGRELYGWTKCRNAVIKNYPWQGRTEGSVTTITNPRINLYNKHYGPTAGSFRDERTWIRYLKELVKLQLDEKGIDAKKGDLILAIHDDMLQKNLRLGLTNENHDQYRQNLEASFNNALDKCKQVFTDREYKAFFGAEKSEKFAFPLEGTFR